MQIRLIGIGKHQKDFIAEGVNYYQKRIQKYITFDALFHKLPGKGSPQQSTHKTIKQEEEKLLANINLEKEHLILLDQHGKQYDSENFSKILQYHFNYYSTKPVFVIGGPYGVTTSLKKKATLTLSLSRMTYSHQMVRLLFMEQLYRAITIIKGVPYHH